MSIKIDSQQPIPLGWECVRCRGTHAYCTDCGSSECVCPVGHKGPVVLCEHDRGALVKIQAPAGAPDPDDNLHPLGLKTQEEVRDFAGSVEWSLEVAGLLGRATGRNIRELSDANGRVRGWQVVWSYEKRDRNWQWFGFNINAFLSMGMRKGRAAEVIFDAHRRFLEHELREAMLVDGSRIFDPHHLDKLEH